MSKQNKSTNQGVSSSAAAPVDNVNKNILSNDIHTDELQKQKQVVITNKRVTDKRAALSCSG